MNPQMQLALWMHNFSMQISKEQGKLHDQARGNSHSASEMK